ncbi:PilW family protein [Rheinheimera sp. UJ51]|uniref:PilW family protein n=1 Tax=Rheinheimera sp. UJ51 TaxID=2892446 RepID=UPI001E54200F|nr:PilW family protein [Rheinheimera sp. UJ51]MCC5452647.1 PilW family protein [Rheinheimera sp. UJ51]
MSLEPIKLHQGLSLVELMIAMTLGLLVTGGVLGIFMANQQTYQVNQTISAIQENSRAVFQLMARDIRSAGFSGCTNSTVMANTLNSNPNTDWWASWNNGIRGFDDGQPTSFNPARVPGTDAIQVMYGGGRSINVEAHTANSANFKVNKDNHGIKEGDIIVACDSAHTAIFQVTNANQNNGTIVHNTGKGTPGNCTKLLGFPVLCDGTGLKGTPYEFTSNAMMMSLQSQAWYVGVNPRNTNSLYRVDIQDGNPIYEEIIDGVEELNFRYLRSGNTAYQTANDINNIGVDEWANVIAVEIELILLDDPKIKLLKDMRRMRQVVAIRNRVE